MSMEPPGSPPPPPAPEPYATPPSPPQPATDVAPARYAPYPVAPSPAAPRRRTPLVAIGLVVLLIVVAIGAYGVGGFLFAQGRINSATEAYNTVVDHQNKLNDFFANLDKQSSSSDPTTASADATKQNKSLFDQLVSQSQAAQPQVNSDDAALADADSKLHENEWLTVFSRSSLDKSSTQIRDARAALGVAKTVLADYIQYGNFFSSLDSAAIDLDTLGNDASASDLAGASTAVQALKADVAKALSLDKASGLPADVDTFMHDLQTLANDFETLLNAAIARDSTAAQTAAKAVDADTTKLDSYDFATFTTAAQAFYSNLIDQYNADIDKANKD